jgi:Xaa-Pro dipeptidase
MAIHFTEAEMAGRLERLRAALAQEKLDGALLFAQESDYWLTGYDTFGFCFFQCLYVGLDGRVALLTRSADLRQAQHTSNIADIRIWRDGADANPALDLRAMLDDLGAGRRLGIEYDSYGLTHFNGRRVETALADAYELVDISSLIPRLRATKSAEELVYVREAARLSDLADAAGLAATKAGADEGDILAAMHSAIFSGGGDYPANEFIIGSGADALLCRYTSGRRKLDAQDQLTLEFAGVSRHYHAAIMRTHVIGDPRPQHLTYHAAAREALDACAAELKVGRVAGDVFAAHSRVLDAHDLARHRLNACGYSLGAKFTPSWMDPPMFYERNPFQIAPNQVYFLHMILMDSDSGAALCLGRTYLTGAGSAEPLNAATLDLGIK